MFTKSLAACSSLLANDGCRIFELLHGRNDAIDLPYSLAVAEVDVGESSYRHRLRQTEVYFILAGRGRMHVDQESRELAIGDTVVIPPQAEQYEPSAGGLLSGKYAADRAAVAGRLNQNPMYAQRYGEPWSFEVAARFAEFRAARGVHPVSMAVAWVAAHPAVTAPIIGARNVEQMQASLDAVKMDMHPALRAELAALSPAPPPATDRSEELARRS